MFCTVFLCSPIWLNADFSVLAVLGMSTTWYVGVIAIKIGDYGGDVGNQLAFVFSLFVYVPARYLELKIVGR